jgi:predicted O-methyltransferase YrrM
MLDLNRLPCNPEDYESSVRTRIPEDFRMPWKSSLMAESESCFVSGLVRLYRPKNILEIGVDRGGGQ